MDVVLSVVVVSNIPLVIKIYLQYGLTHNNEAIFLRFEDNTY